VSIPGTVVSACSRSAANHLLKSQYYQWSKFGETPELKDLLESYSPQWGVLRMDISNANERIVHSVGRLREHSHPSLHTLDLNSYKSFDRLTTDHLRLHCPPGLRVLCLRGIWPVFSASPSSLTDPACVSYAPRHWTRWLDVLGSCPLVQRLIVDLEDCMGSAGEVIIPSVAQVALPSLRRLEIEGIMELHLPWFSTFLSCCDAPNLESMAIRPLCSGPINVWRIVVGSQSSLPHAQLLYCFAGTRPQYKVSFN
jgi:hypothetical protein